MAIAASNLTQLRFAPESAFGVTPTTGDHTALRMTSESLSGNVSTVKSAEIRSDRMISDLVLTGQQAGGGFNFEMSYKEYDPFLEAALSGTWAAYGVSGVGASFTATFTATTITASVAPTGNSAFTNLAKGQWFRLNAPTHANNGKVFRVSSTVDPTPTVIQVDSNTPLATGTGIANCTLSSSRLVNGVTKRSFSIERFNSDVSQYFTYKGMVLDKMSMDVTPGQIVTGNFEFMGKNHVRGSSSGLAGTTTASQSYTPVNAVSGVPYLFEAGAPIPNTYVKSMKFEVMNNLRGLEAVSVLGNADVNLGSFDVSGEIEVYLADGAMYDKFLNNTVSSIAFAMTDTSGNGYGYTFPRLKYRDVKVNAGGMNQDMILTMPFDAFFDPVTGKSFIIDRFGA